MAVSVIPDPQISRLTCRAPHAKQPGKPCGGPLGDVPGAYEYVTHAARAPGSPDGFTWLRCTNCRRWNKWRAVLTPLSVVTKGSVEERLAAFPENQQQAILALAGGMRPLHVARAVNVSDRTIRSWCENPEFQALRLAVAPALTASHLRTALETLMTLISKEGKSGIAGTHTRYLLNRTLFAEFEKQRAAAGGGTAINLNVAQHQQQTQATVKTIWEERHRALGTSVDPED
jgi:hypothetical protein